VGDGLVEPASDSENITEVDVGSGVVRLHVERLLALCRSLAGRASDLRTSPAMIWGQA
jgi:hypothetical protein